MGLSYHRACCCLDPECPSTSPFLISEEEGPWNCCWGPLSRAVATWPNTRFGSPCPTDCLETMCPGTHTMFQNPGFPCNSTWCSHELGDCDNGSGSETYVIEWGPQGADDFRMRCGSPSHFTEVTWRNTTGSDAFDCLGMKKGPFNESGSACYDRNDTYDLTFTWGGCCYDPTWNDDPENPTQECIEGTHGLDGECDGI